MNHPIKCRYCDNPAQTTWILIRGHKIHVCAFHNNDLQEDLIQLRQFHKRNRGMS